MATYKAKPIPQFTETQIANFWRKVDKRGPDECWPWTGKHDERPYGIFTHYGKVFRSHRVAFYLAHGEDPGEFRVLHSCDSPPCVNPSHLRRGTQRDNALDRDSRGRSGTAKLTEEQVREFLAEYPTSRNKGLVCERFGITRGMAWIIATRKSWRHVSID